MTRAPLREALAVLALALGAAGCVTYERGALGVAAVHPPPLPLVTVVEDVEGRACGSLQADQYDRALANALLVAPGADALVDASWRFESFCVVVRGRAVRVAPPPPPATPPEPDAPEPEPNAPQPDAPEPEPNAPQPDASEPEPDAPGPEEPLEAGG